MSFSGVEDHWSLRFSSALSDWNLKTVAGDGVTGLSKAIKTQLAQFELNAGDWVRKAGAGGSCGGTAAICKQVAKQVPGADEKKSAH